MVSPLELRYAIAAYLYQKLKQKQTAKVSNQVSSLNNKAVKKALQNPKVLKSRKI